MHRTAQNLGLTIVCLLVLGLLPQQGHAGVLRENYLLLSGEILVIQRDDRVKVWVATAERREINVDRGSMEVAIHGKESETIEVYCAWANEVQDQGRKLKIEGDRLAWMDCGQKPTSTNIAAQPTLNNTGVVSPVLPVPESVEPPLPTCGGGGNDPTGPMGQRTFSQGACVWGSVVDVPGHGVAYGCVLYPAPGPGTVTDGVVYPTLAELADGGHPPACELGYSEEPSEEQPEEPRIEPPLPTCGGGGNDPTGPMGQRTFSQGACVWGSVVDVPGHGVAYGCVLYPAPGPGTVTDGVVYPTLAELADGGHPPACELEILEETPEPEQPTEEPVETPMPETPLEPCHPHPETGRRITGSDSCEFSFGEIVWGSTVTIPSLGEDYSCVTWSAPGSGSVSDGVINPDEGEVPVGTRECFTPPWGESETPEPETPYEPTPVETATPEAPQEPTVEPVSTEESWTPEPTMEVIETPVAEEPIEMTPEPVPTEESYVEPAPEPAPTEETLIETPPDVVVEAVVPTEEPATDVIEPETSQSEEDTSLCLPLADSQPDPSCASG